MPYFHHPRDAAPTDTIPLATFATKADAAAGLPSTHAIKFLGRPDEITAWHTREYDRLNGGTYRQVPPLPKAVAVSNLYPHHYMHLSDGNPGLVAYTPDDESGITGRRVRLKPGKYLTKFYASLLTPAEIVTWSDAVKAASEGLQIAFTKDDCVRVYRAPRGYQSCMSPTSSYGASGAWDAATDPAQVYGGGDAAVAYLGDIRGSNPRNHTVDARCVVNVSAQKFYRPYGTKSGELRELLTRAGYTQTEEAMAGARILACQRAPDQTDARRSSFSDSKVYVIPYVDGVSYGMLTDDGHVLLQSGGGAREHATADRDALLWFDLTSQRGSSTPRSKSAVVGY